jgi:hypothetical protein
METEFKQSDLEAYLDEALPGEEMAAVEHALRTDKRLAARLSSIHSRRNAGVHSVGEIWRKHRLSCPSKEQLGSYLLEALPDETADYIAFHLQVAGCRICAANLADMQDRQKEDREVVDQRRRKYFQSSAGYLRSKR